MALHVALTHCTTYRYDRPVSLGPHIVRLRPAPACRTPILAYSLRITPGRHFIKWQQDPFGNIMARIVVPDEAREFTTTVDLIADMAPFNPLDFFLDTGAATWPIAYEPVLARELGPYLETLPDTPLMREYAAAPHATSASCPRHRVRTPFIRAATAHPRSRSGPHTPHLPRLHG